MAYFDNAATTFPKPEAVYSFMDKFYRSNGASAGRGNYRASLSAGTLIAETRQLLQALLHCQAKQVVFTPTATIALNIVLQGLIKNGVKEVYISPFEHNAVTRTLHAYTVDGQIKVHKLAVSENMIYDLERIRYQFENKHPDLVIVSHASNVFGLIAPIEEIFQLSKQFNAYTVADMAQTAGLVDCNVGSAVFDFAIFAGHKTLYGPTGISGFVMKPEIELPSVLYGGTGYDSANQDMSLSLPERFEMGTMNISGIAGLHAALTWINEISLVALREKETRNRQRLLKILNDYWFIKVVGNYLQNEYIGIISCLIDGISSDSAGKIFDNAGIAVRTGLQCAPLAHEFMKTYPAGTIRFSVSYFTSEQDFQELIQVLDQIEDNI